MRVFARYILRSIKKSPIQPILILLTLTVAVATLVSGAKVVIQLDREQKQESASTYSYDLSVALSSKSDTRILLTEEVKRVIGDGGDVLGEFGLKGYVSTENESRLIEICAVDIAEADKFHKFRFTEYETVSDRTLGSSIILSTVGAKDLGLGIGDVLSMRVLDESFDFTVRGIALPDGTLANNYGIIDISAVIGALIKANPAIAPAAEGLHPASTVIVRLSDPESAESYRDMILADEELAHTLVSISSDEKVRDSFEYKIWFLLTILVIFIVILISVIVISTSESLLSVQRRTDTALFMISGAEPSQLSKISYLESLIYSLIASILGLLLSLPINTFINSVFEWKYYDLALESFDILLAIAFAPAVVMLSSYINNRRNRNATVSELLSEGLERKQITNSRLPLFVLSPVLLITVICALALPPKSRFPFAIIALVTVTLLAYFEIPKLVRLGSELISRQMQRLERIPTRIYLAIRALGASHPLIHSVRILSVLTSLLLAIAICLGRGKYEVKVISNVFDCGYVITNLDDKDDGLIRAESAVESIYRVAIIGGVSTHDGEAMMSFSVEDGAYGYINEAIRPDKPLGGKEIAISRGLAAKYAKNTGDEFTVINDSHEYTFTISQILDAGSNIAIINADDIDKSDNVVCVVTKSDATLGEITSLRAVIESRGALMTSIQSETSRAVSKVSSFLSLIGVVALAALAATLMGATNLLISVHTKRRRERELYFTIGMTRGEVRQTTITEIAVIITACLVFIPVLALANTLLMDMAANSFGFDIIF